MNETAGKSETAGANQRSYLDPAALARLAHMDLKARLVVEGFVAGLHRSPHRGFSVEFAEHRPYMPGDPLKHVNWKVYAKSDRFYVKEFEEETNLRAMILLDVSGSMGFGTTAMNKLEYGAHLAAALTYLMLKQRDSVGLLLFDREIRRYLPPRSSHGQLHYILRELAASGSGEKTDVARALHHLAERIKRRGLIILISDLMDTPDAVLRGLRHFRHRKHELLVFHVLDPAEVSLPYDQEVVLKDLETGAEVLTEPWQIRSGYRDAVSRWRDSYRNACREARIDYVPLDTATPYDRALLGYLTKRKKLG